MNKIERAIYDCKLHVDNLKRDRITLIAEINLAEKILESLELIERDKSIPNETIKKSIR